MKKQKMTSEHIQLSPKSWILVNPHAVECTPSEFKEFWSLCPTQRDSIKMFGKSVLIPRFQKLFGTSSYKYSGITLTADPVLPEIVQRCIDYAKQNWADFNWNGSLVNWYPDGSSHIGAHSDDEKDLQKGAPILSFSFGGVRTFRVRPKKTTVGEKIDFSTLHSSVLIMCGSMQSEFTHEITKTAKPVEPRINVTVRCFTH